MPVVMLVLVISDWGFWSSVIGSEEGEEVKGLLFGLICRLRVRACQGAVSFQLIDRLLFSVFQVCNYCQCFGAKVFRPQWSVSESLASAIATPSGNSFVFCNLLFKLHDLSEYCQFHNVFSLRLNATSALSSSVAFLYGGEMMGLFLFGLICRKRVRGCQGAAASARSQVVTAQLVNGGLPLIGVLA